MSRTVLHVALTLLLPMASTLPAGAGPWTEKVVVFSQEAPGVSDALYSSGWTHFKSLGYAPVSVSGVEKSGAAVRYSGLWAKDPSILDWSSKRKLTDAEYQDAWDDLVGAGFRVLDLDAHTIGNSPRFNVIFVRESPAKPFFSHRALTLGQLDAKVVEYKAQGYRPIRINGYRVGSSTSAQRYTAVWVKDGPTDAILRRDLTSAQYAAAWATYKEADYRPVDIAAYPTASGLRYAGIWLRVPNQPAWVSKRELTLSALDSERLAQKKANYVMTDLDSYYMGNELRYSAIWVRTQPKNVLRSNVALSGSLMTSLQNSINGYITAGADGRKGNLGFYVEDLTNGNWIAFNPHEPFYLASAAKTFIASKVVDMPELPESATHQLRLSDWRGESSRGFTTLDIGKFFPISEYLDNMIDGSDSASTDRLIGLAESFDGAKTVNAHLKNDAQMIQVGEITSICTLDKRIYSFRDSCINAVPCSSFEQWSRANSIALSSAADVACFDDVDDSPVSWNFAYDAYYHSLANSVSPAEVGRFFRRLADHELHDVFDEASLVRQLDKNNTYSSFSGTFYDAWAAKTAANTR